MLVLVADSPYYALAASMLLQDAETGANKTVSVALLSQTYPQRTGLALSVFDTFGLFAGVAPTAAIVFVTVSGRLRG